MHNGKKTMSLCMTHDSKTELISPKVMATLQTAIYLTKPVLSSHKREIKLTENDRKCL